MSDQIDNFRKKLQLSQQRLNDLRSKETLLQSLLEKRQQEKEKLRLELIDKGVDVENLDAEEDRLVEKITTAQDLLDTQLSEYAEKLQKIQEKVM